MNKQLMTPSPVSTNMPKQPNPAATQNPAAAQNPAVHLARRLCQAKWTTAALEDFASVFFATEEVAKEEVLKEVPEFVPRLLAATTENGDDCTPLMLLDFIGPDSMPREHIPLCASTLVFAAEAAFRKKNEDVAVMTIHITYNFAKKHSDSFTLAYEGRPSAFVALAEMATGRMDEVDSGMFGLLCGVLSKSPVLGSECLRSGVPAMLAPLLSTAHDDFSASAWALKALALLAKNEDLDLLAASMPPVVGWLMAIKVTKTPASRENLELTIERLSRVPSLVFKKEPLEKIWLKSFACMLPGVDRNVKK